MRTRRFGRTGREVSRLGFGAMPFSLEGRPPRDEAMRVLRAVRDLGVTLFDTADTYGLGPDDLHHNEHLLAELLRESGPAAARMLIASKGGCVRTNGGWEIDGHPDRLYRVIADSCAALGRPVDVWQHHWPDARHPVSVSLRAAKRAQDEGLLRHVGVGNYSLAQLREAMDVVEVVSIQNQFNLWHREAERDGMLAFCEANDIVFLPWRPMGGLGLAQRLGEIRPLADLAARKGVSPQRLMIAWHLAKSPCLLPIPGSRHPAHAQDALAADGLDLTAEDVAQLDAVGGAELPVRERPPAWDKSPGLARNKQDSTERNGTT